MKLLAPLAAVGAASLPLLIVATWAAAEPHLSFWARLGLVLGSLAFLLVVVVNRVYRPLRHMVTALRAGSTAEALWRLERLHRKYDHEIAANRAANELIEDLTSSVGDGLIVVDEDLRLRLINPEAWRFCRVNQLTVGTPLPEVLRDPGVLEAARAAARGEHPPAQDLEERDGIWQVRTYPVRRGGAVLVLTEVGLLRRSTELRRRFVQDLAHELRSPLTVLRTSVEALEGDVDSDTAELLVRQVDRITRLSEELRELASIESGELELRPTNVCIADVVRDCTADLAARAEADGVRLTTDVPQDLTIHSDGMALTRIVRNLLENAVKYGVQGGTAGVSASLDPDDSVLILVVHDDGVGIPADEVGAVFQRFYRVDRGRSPGTGGLGLGLAIVKHLVNRLGGTVRLDSREGVGTTVTVEVPPLPEPKPDDEAEP